MQPSIESQLEITKVNKITEKLSEGYSIESICKDLGISVRQLVGYISNPDIEAALGSSHKALKALIFHKLSILVESSLDKLEYLQQELIRDCDEDSSKILIGKIMALNALVGTYLKSLSAIQIPVEDAVRTPQGLSEETIQAICEKIVRL